jgi:hypothetical protein
MAEDKQDTPQQGEIAAEDLRIQRLADRLAMVDAPPAAPAARGAGNLPAVAPGRQSLMVGQPGRMVLGSRMATPNLTADELGAAIEKRQLFTSAHDVYRRRISSRAMVLALCAFAVGSATGLVWLIDGMETAGQGARAVNKIARPADGAVASAPGGALRPVASVTPVAAVTPVTIDQPPAKPGYTLARNKAATLTVKDITTEAGIPAPLDINVEHDNSGDYTFLMFRGLPEGFGLSAGFPLKGAWAVSLNDLVDLTLIPPEGYSGRFDLEIMLVIGREKPVESQRVSVTFKEQGPSAPVVAEAAPVPHILTAAPPSRDEELRQENSPLSAPAIAAPAPAPAPAAAKPVLTPEKELPMLERGYSLLGDGDIASARLLFEHLARKGSGRGALALAQTFDPLYMRSMNTLGGPRPEPETARKWYNVAVQLGQDAAKERLSTLSSQ